MRKSSKIWLTVIAILAYGVLSTMIREMARPSRALSVLALLSIMGLIAMIWTTQTTVPTKATSIDDKIAQLRDLQKLHDTNVISEEEFQKMKQKILE